MGRFIKNYQFQTGSYAVKLPYGTNSFGPQVAEPGMIRFNTEKVNLEIYYAGAWRTTSEGRVQIIKDEFTGDGSQVTWTMSTFDLATYIPGNEACIIVFVGNVFQNPGVAYTINGNQITFTSVPNLGLPIIILHNFNSTQVS